MQRIPNVVMGGTEGDTLISRLGPSAGDPKLRALVKNPEPTRHTPLFRFEELTPERGPQRAVAQFVGGLTTPENAAIVAGIGKLKRIPEVGKALTRAASGGFSIQMLTGALQSDPEWTEAKQSGNKAIMSEIVVRKGLELIFGTLAGKHALSGAKPIERGTTPPPPEAERLQRYSTEASRQGREFASALRPGEAPPPEPPAPAPATKPDLISGRTPEATTRLTRPMPPRMGDEPLVSAAMDQLEKSQLEPKRLQPEIPRAPEQPSLWTEESGEQRVPSTKDLQEGLVKARGLVGQILQVHQQTGGSTFNVRNEQNLAGQKVYSVSPFKELETVLDHSPTSEDITGFIGRPGVREKLFDPSGKFSLGTWEDKSEGKTYLDVVVTTPDLSEALEIGRKAKQIAAFDLSKVDPQTGDVAEGAEIPIPAAPGKKLYHWGRQPGLETLDPKFYGTGEAGAEMRRKRNAGPDWVDRTYYTETPKSPEPSRFGPGTRAPHPYEVEVPEERIYDLTKDPEGFVQAANGDLTVVEKTIKERGFAGYKGAYPDGTPAYAMFDPIKAKKMSEAGFLNLKDLDEGVNWFERKMIDDLSDIRRFTSDAKLPDELDPYKLAILHAGRGGKMVRRLIRKGGLREIIRPAYKEGLYQEMVDYSLVERYEELARPKSQGGHGITRFPNGLTLTDIQAQKVALEAKLGPQKLAKVKGYIQQLYRYSDQILQEARDGGLISAQTYARIKANNEKYVPLQRIAYLYDQIENMTPGSNIFSVPAQDLVKTVAGSEKEVLNPIQGIIRNTIKSVALVSRNRVALAMANLADDPRFQGSVIRLRKGMQAPDGMDAFSVLREGRKEVYAAPRLVVEAMKRMNPEQGDVMTRMMAASGEFLKAGAVTFNMAFIPANAIRDFQTATLKSEVGFTPWDWAKGLTRAIFKGDVYDKYLESGGAFGGLYEQLGKGGEIWETSLTTGKRSRNRLAQFEREMKGQFTLRHALSLANPLEYIRAAGQIIEQAPRIGAFERAMRKGKSLEGAGFLSRDVTVNFSKAGSAMRVLNLWSPFLNARQQGLLNTLRAVKDHPGRAALILTAMVGVPALATYLHNTRQHKDVWDDIAEFEKRNNFIIIYGDERDEDGNPTQVIKIPKGDVGQMFGNPLEHFLAWMDGKEPQRVDKLALQWASDISPVQFEREGKLSGLAVASSVAPPTPKAVLEGLTNKNWYTGREIVGQKHRLQEASPKEQYWTDTPPAVVTVAQFLGVSPKKLQNFIGTQFGGLGRQLMEPTKAQKSVTKRFVGAHGGGKEEREFETLTGIKQEGADVAVQTNRAVQSLFDRMMKAQPQERQQMIVEAAKTGKLDERGIIALADLVEAKALGLTDFERYLKSAAVPDRAKYVVKRMRELPAAERAKTFERWAEKGLLTDDVLDQIIETAPAGVP